MVRRPAREALLQDVVFGRSKRLTKNGAAKKKHMIKQRPCWHVLLVHVVMCGSLFWDVFNLFGWEHHRGGRRICATAFFTNALAHYSKQQIEHTRSMFMFNQNLENKQMMSWHNILHKTSTNNRSVAPPVLSWFITPINYTYKNHDSEWTIKTNLQKSSRYPGPCGVDERPMPISWHVRIPSSWIQLNQTWLAGKPPNKLEVYSHDVVL